MSRIVGPWGRGVAMCAVLGLCACRGEAPSVDVGRPAPPYEAKTLEGAPVSLQELRGRPVLVNVWATWCAPCREEIPYLARLYDEYQSQGLEIVGVSIDARGEEEKITSFAKDFAMRYPIWLDPNQRISAVFLAFGVPASYLVDRKGVLRWKHVGVLRPTNGVFTAALEEVLRERGAQ